MDFNLSFLCYAFFFITVFLSLSIFLQCDVWLLDVNFLPHHYVFFNDFSMVLSIYLSDVLSIVLSIFHHSALFCSLLLLWWCVLIFLVYILL